MTLAHIAVKLIKLYRMFGSPFFAGCCRFEPSCSAYAIEAFEQHGFSRGAWLTLQRLARCQPWGSAGFDPVPRRGH